MIAIRPAVASDGPFLQEMLYEAVFTPVGAPRPGREVLDEPEVARYVAGWGRAGDHGFVAEAGGRPVGAAWFRVLPPDAPGFGFVAAEIPELSIALLPEFRGAGLGTALLKILISEARADGYQGLSLSVDPDNPAARLYPRLGFRKVGVAGGSTVMLLTWESYSDA